MGDVELTIFEHDLIAPGQAVSAGWGNELYVSPYNEIGERAGKYLFTKTPFNHRYSLGMREAARAKRREWKGLACR